MQNSESVCYHDKIDIHCFDMCFHRLILICAYNFNLLVSLFFFIHTCKSVFACVFLVNARNRAAVKEAERHGEKLNNRISMFFIGQDGVGKTSLKKNLLLGQDFNPQEPSTVGIDVDLVEVKQDNRSSPWQRAEDQQPFVTQKHIDNAVVEIAASLETSSGEDKDTARTSDQGVKEESIDSIPSRIKDSVDSAVDEVVERGVENCDDGVINEVGSKGNISNNSKDGEEQDEIRLRNLMEKVAEEQKKVERYTDELEMIRFLMYDVAGQSIFYDVHSVLLRLQALFVLVVSLDKVLDAKAESLFVGEDNVKIKIENYLVETNLDHAIKWMATLHSLSECDPKNVEVCGQAVTLPAAFVVFSKPDKFKGLQDQMVAAQAKLMKTIATCGYGVHIVETFVINNERPDKGKFY